MSDHYEPSEDETPPLCVGESVPAPTTFSSKRKRLACTLPLLLAGVLLCNSAGTLSPARGAAQLNTHLSPAHTRTISAPLTSPQVVERDRPAIVKILAKDCQDHINGYGSGEIIDPRGYIVTNYHVVNGAPKFSVQLFDNSELPARLVGVDPADDLAVLKVTTVKHLFVIPIDNSSRLQLGEQVLAIGYPLSGLVDTAIGKSAETEANAIDGATITSGLISALGRTQMTPIEGVTSEITDTIQTDASINPGNSGGALVNMQAQLIGIPEKNAPELIPSPYGTRVIKGISFAIPSNRVAFVIPQLIQYGHMIRSGHATMNATLVSVNPELATMDSLAVDHGAYISAVADGSAAALAGLREGDVIVQVNETPITNAMEVNDALMPADAGTMITLGVVRGTQNLQIPVKLQALPINVEIAPTQQCSSSNTPVIGKG